MDELPEFLQQKNSDLKIKQEPEDENENEDSENINEEEEEEEDIKKENNNNSDDDDDDDSMDIDEDRLTLPQIRERIKKKQAKTKNISLLNKKTTRAQNITYDANTKSLRDCFIPDMDQLKSFLDNCVVKEIFEDDTTSLLKDRKQDVFDPQKFMLSNGINKSSISFEDLSLFEDNKNKEKVPEIIEEKPKQSLKKPKMTVDDFISTSIYKSKDKEHKEKVKEQFRKFREIMSTNILTLDQKKFLAEFIKNISALPIEEILIKDKKFEIVFDLDNTCMFSYLCNNGREEGIAIMSKYKNKNIKCFEFEYQGKKMYSILILRKGLKEFLGYIKDLANFHISTLAAKNYAEKIVEMLAKDYKIEFKKFSSRNNSVKNRKYINDLNNDENLLFPELSESNTIIFDDSVSVWEKENESFNVIPSKKFVDKELKMPNVNPNNKAKSHLDIFLDTYSPYSYNQFKKEKEPSWKKQSIVTKLNCPFYQYKNKDTINYNESFFAEYFNSPKYQFIYMKNVIKVLYCLVFHNDLEISDAIKLVRLNALNGKKFYLKFLNDEQKNILKDIIETCGGEVHYPPVGEEESIIDLSKKIFLVVSKREYSIREKEIYKEIREHNNYILINEKFILDSYYFMTDLGESYKDKEYTDFIDDDNE